MADQINYYEVLGVPREASQAEIRNAYRNLAKERHPDHPGGSAEEFSRLQEANAVLSDPNRRRQHDEALDLAHAADQLAGLNLDFGSVEDELSAKRRERESSGPSLGERLRGRFGRKEEDPYESMQREARDSGRGGGRRTRGRYDVSEARWYEPHRFDPEPVTLKSGALSFVAAFLAFIAIGQIGLWATGGVEPGSSVSLRSWPRSCPSCTRWSGWSLLTSPTGRGLCGAGPGLRGGAVVGGQGPRGSCSSRPWESSPCW